RQAVPGGGGANEYLTRDGSVRRSAQRGRVREPATLGRGLHANLGRAPPRGSPRADARRARLEAGERLYAHRVDHGGELTRPLVDGDLPIGAGALFDDSSDVLAVFTRSEFVHHVVDELEPFFGEIAHRHLALLAPVDQLAGNSVSSGAPFVLRDQRRRVLAE